MKSKDKDSTGASAGGGSEDPGLLHSGPGRKGGEGMVDDEELKTVRLVCLFCRDTRVIHVPVHCDTPKEVLWECLSCQERWAARK